MYAISIDSGGTKVVGAVVDEEGRILTKSRHEIPERDGNYLVGVFKNIITQYSQDYPIDVVGTAATDVSIPSAG